MIPESYLFKLWKGTHFHSEFAFEEFRKAYYAKKINTAVKPEEILEDLETAKKLLEKSANPFDDACTIVRDSYEKTLFLTSELEAVKEDARALLDTIRKGGFDWNASLPRDTHWEEMGLACRKISDTLRKL